MASSNQTENGRKLASVDVDYSELLKNIDDDIVFAMPTWKVQSYLCCYCNRFARYPFITTDCEHLICEICYVKNMNKCPCNLPITNVYKDPELGKEISQLSAYCPFSSAGCKEIVIVKDYMAHKEACIMNPKREWMEKRIKWTEMKLAEQSMFTQSMAATMVQLHNKINSLEAECKVIRESHGNQLACDSGPLLGVKSTQQEFTSRRLSKESKESNVIGAFSIPWKIPNFREFLLRAMGDMSRPTIESMSVRTRSYKLDLKLQLKFVDEEGYWCLCGSVVNKKVIFEEDQVDYQRLSFTLSDTTFHKHDVTVTRERKPGETFVDWMNRFSADVKLVPPVLLLAKESPYVRDNTIDIIIQISE